MTVGRVTRPSGILIWSLMALAVTATAIGLRRMYVCLTVVGSKRHSGMSFLHSANVAVCANRIFR